jgi:hypothetical protein
MIILFVGADSCSAKAELGPPHAREDARAPGSDGASPSPPERIVYVVIAM